MWVDKHEWERLQEKLDRMEKAYNSLNLSYSRLLSHLKLVERNFPGTPAETRLITQKEYDEKYKESDEKKHRIQAMYPPDYKPLSSFISSLGS
jgi:hypothetical protein